jgi:hypothetical protein
MSSQSSLFEDLPRRRLWLLSKALEAVPLREALELAQAVENFLDGAPPSDGSLPISPRDPGQWARGLSQDDTAIPVASADRLGDAGAVIEPAPLPSGAAPADASDIQEDEAPYASTGDGLSCWRGPMMSCGTSGGATTWSSPQTTVRT